MVFRLAVSRYLKNLEKVTQIWVFRVFTSVILYTVRQIDQLTFSYRYKIYVCDIGPHLIHESVSGLAMLIPGYCTFENLLL